METFVFILYALYYTQNTPDLYLCSASIFQNKWTHLENTLQFDKKTQLKSESETFQ